MSIIRTESLVGKTVLVTGGTGFIGGHTSLALAREGAEVRIVDNKGELPGVPKHGHDYTGMRIQKHNLLNAEECSDVYQGVNAMVHLAGVAGGISFLSKHPASVLLANTKMDMIVLELLRRFDIEKFVYVSSAYAYPDNSSTPLEDEAKEQAVFNPRVNGYAWAKRSGEIACRTYGMEYGIKTTTLRLFNVYGPHDDFDPSTCRAIPSIIRRVVNRERPLSAWGSAGVRRSYIYVKDAADAVVKSVANAPVSGPINIASSETVTMKELVEKIACADNYVDADVVFDASKPSGHDLVAKVEKAKRVIGFAAETPLETGLKDTISWYRRNLTRQGIQ